MTREVLQNTARPFKIYMVEDSDNKTPVTGLVGSFTVTLAKSGLPESTVAPTITERGNGWYEVTPLAAHRDTLGESAWTFTGGSAAAFPRLEEVVAYDSQDGSDLGLSQLALIEAMRGTNGANTIAPPSAPTIANAVEEAILDEGDATPLLAAIAAKVEEFLINEGDAAATLAAIAAAVRVSLAVELARIDENVSEAKTLSAAYDAAKSAASQSSVDVIAGNVSAMEAAMDQLPDDVWMAFGQEELAKFVTLDTGQTAAAAGSVALLSQGSGGSGDTDEELIASLVIAGLGSLKVTLVSPYDQKTKTLKLVQRADYTPTSLIGPIRIKIEHPGVQAGDTVRLGVSLPGQPSIQSTGEVVMDGGDFYAEISLTKESHTDRNPTSHGKFELEHVNDGGEVSPLLADKDAVILPSHAE